MSGPLATERLDAALVAIREEVLSAMDRFAPFNSPHEGYAVILEEVDELWQEVKHGSRTSAHPEAVQVAAMAVRFLVDLYGEREKLAALGGKDE